jgi:flavodoxin
MVVLAGLISSGEVSVKGYCERGNELSGSIKCREVAEQLSDL